MLDTWKENYCHERGSVVRVERMASGKMKVGKN